MAYRALVVTPWVSMEDDPSAKPRNHPLIWDEYTLKGFTDVTEQPAANISPDPNEYTVLVECEGDVLAAIQSDADYEVLWLEEITEDA